MSLPSLEVVADLLHRLDLRHPTGDRDLGRPSAGCLHPDESGNEGNPGPSGVQKEDAGIRGPDDCENDRLIKKYKNISYLGFGSFGLVVKAYHCLDQSACAIKLIAFTSDKTKAVLREVRSMANLPMHQNIVSYKACWIQESKSLDRQLINKFRLCCDPVPAPEFFMFIKMEFLDDNLENWLANRNEIFIKERSIRGEDIAFQDIQHSTHKQIFLDILEGLMFLHNRGIIHRDLKPANILIDLYTQYCKIGDFGLAKIFESNGQEMTRCGSPRYCAPEQYLSNDYDLSVDIYSLGLILLEDIYPVQYTGGRSEHFINSVLPTFNHPEIAATIREMTDTDPARRPALEDIRSKDWFSLWSGFTKVASWFFVSFSLDHVLIIFSSLGSMGCSRFEVSKNKKILIMFQLSCLSLNDCFKVMLIKRGWEQLNNILSEPHISAGNGKNFQTS